MALEKHHKIGIALIALLALGLGGFWGYQYLKAYPAKQGYLACHDAVKRNLKAPATAKFQKYDTVHQKKLGDGDYFYEFHLDAQNPMGALMGSEWVCRATKHDSGWKAAAITQKVRQKVKEKYNNVKIEDVLKKLAEK